MSSLPPRIVLYDGVCGLCNKTVAWLIARDGRRALAFAPLQGPTTAALRARHPDLPITMSTVVFVEEGRLWLRSAAIFAILRHLASPWRHVAWLRHVGWLCDPGYWLVARLRYRIWGKTDACRLPSASERAQLLP